MSFAGLIQMSTVAALSFAATTTLVCAVAYPLSSRRLHRLTPGVRAWTLVGIAAAPLACGVVLTALAIAPSLLSALGLLADHCGEPRHSHAHLCVVHPPVSSGHDLPWILAGLVAALGAAAIGSAARTLVEGARIARRLRAASRHVRRLDACVVSSETPLALTSGLIRHTIFLSSGLLRALPSAFLEVVMAHERAHVARHDTLRLLIASVLAWFHLPSISRRLLADLVLAHEEACDDRAVVAVGSRLVVARAIVAVERLLGGALPAPAAAFTAGNLSARVERLLREEGEESAVRSPMLGTTLAVVLLLAFVLAPVHHLTETYLHLVLGS